MVWVRMVKWRRDEHDGCVLLEHIPDVRHHHVGWLEVEKFR
jgi:hypothetical protein